MRTTPILLALLLVAPVAARAADTPEDPAGKLPPGAAALVHGVRISMDEFRAALVTRHARSRDGERILGLIVEEIVVEAERKRKGVRVTDAEVDAYVADVEKQILVRSANTKSLDGILKDQEVTRETFRATTHDFLLRQKMAAAALGKKGEVTRADLKIWLDDLMKRSGVVRDRSKLPAGVYAKVGDRTIGAKEFGDKLLDKLSASQLEGALWELVITRAIRQRLEAEGVVITEADLDASVEDLRLEFRENPSYRNAPITFEQYLEHAKNLSIADLKADPDYRSRVGLSKLLRGRLTAKEVKDYYEEHADRYGEERRFLHLLVEGEERKNPFGKEMRSMDEAKRLIDSYHRSYLKGVSSFETLVKEHSEARSQTVDPEVPIPVTKEMPLPPALKRVVFDSPVGEVVGPVKTTLGYHLVKVVGVTPAPTFEEAKAGVLRDLVAELRAKEIAKIRQDPEIVLRY